MVSRSLIHCQANDDQGKLDPWKNWQEQLQQLIKTPHELLTYLNIPTDKVQGLEASQQFPLRVPLSFAARMTKGDLNDPLLRQVLPLDEEMKISSGFSLDPLSEWSNNPRSGLIHKYHGRVLLIASTHCAINCRYCFRRHFPYQDNKPSRQQWQEAFDYIRQNSSITEIILSGGDPLSLSDGQLQWLCQQLANINHVKRLRIHSRLPIVLPSRINDNFVTWLTELPLQKVMVIHCNHPQEINGEVHVAMQDLKQAGVAIFNQAVLLKGINDNAKILANLSESLFSANILPYYLHLLDPVQGAKHFQVSESRARTIHNKIRGILPGFLVPKLVKEEPGAQSKTLI